MKNFTLSVATVLALSTFAVAGGDIAPVVEPVVEVAPASDDSGFYIGGAYSSADVDESWSADDDGASIYTVGDYEEEHDAFMLQVGYQFNKYFALEGRYWTSISDPDWSEKYDSYYYSGALAESWSGSGSCDCDLSAWGIYIKPMYPLTEEFTVYGLLGYGNVTLDDGGYDWIDENGFQWGIGASYAITEHLSIFADYVRLLDGEDGSSIQGTAPYTITHTWEDDVDTINVGITYKF